MSVFSEVLQSKKSIKDDEYYTLLKDVEKLGEYKEYFRDKIIYCPFDNEDSNFVKYFKSNFNEFNIKELIYTSDDYLTHRDLLWKADIIISNPPFSRLRELLNELDRLEKKFILIVPQHCFTYKIVVNHIKKWGILGDRVGPFMRPDGSLKDVACFYMTNITNHKEKYNFIAKFEDIKKEYDDDYGYLNINRLKDIPIDYYDYMLVPVTLFRFFDYREFIFYGLESKIHINGKQIFKRYLIKRRDKYGDI